MTTHLALLRGINVSGHNMIKMEALKKALIDIGFKDVQTYIQSGNVFVKSKEENASAVEDCFSNNLYLQEKDIDSKKLYVAFISKTLTKEAMNELKISQVKPDECLIDGNKIFIKYDKGAGKTKFDQKYIEKKLQVTATIRNWNTVTKLLELYKEIEI